MKRNKNIPRRVDYTLLDCVLGGEKGIYFSTPMTNGPRLVAWHQANGGMSKDSDSYEALFHKHVFLPNCLEANQVAEVIRLKTKKIVINPACYDVHGWSQEDYLTLWCCVIEKYAEEIWFNNGWEYSNGCVREFLTAQECGLPTMNLVGERLSLKKAISDIERAILDLEEVRLSSANLRVTLELLKTY